MPPKQGTPAETPVSGPLRETIDARELKAYTVAKMSGLDVAAVSRFMAGGGLTITSADKLAAALGLKLVARGRGTAKPKRRKPPSSGDWAMT